MVTDSELKWAYDIGSKLAQLVDNNPGEGSRILSMLFERAMNSEGFKKEASRKMGHNPIENPQESWEKLMYTPVKFKPGKDGKELSPDEKKKKLWNSIRLKNLFGDVLTGAGAIGGTVPAIMAEQMEGSSRASATRRQKDLYGETATGRASAAASPLFRGLAALMPTLSGIAAHRFYQEAGDQRNAYLQALSDATFNNMAPPASYMHERRLAAEGTAPVAPQVTPPQGGR